MAYPDVALFDTARAGGGVRWGGEVRRANSRKVLHTGRRVRCASVVGGSEEGAVLRHEEDNFRRRLVGQPPCYLVSRGDPDPDTAVFVPEPGAIVHCWRAGVELKRL